MKISIITINLNNVSGLENTLSSVRAQTFRDFEQIVVDGGSSDGSVDVIRANSDWIAQWISEPDSGIYNAMNKGVRMASGDYLLFLNSGDCLASPKVLENVFQNSLNDSDIIFGETLRKIPGGGVELRTTPAHLTPFAFYKFRICHQSVIYHRSVFDIHGIYDESYKISADAEFGVRCVCAGVKSRRVDFPIALYEGGGVSATDTTAANAENKRIWDKYLGQGIREDYDRMAYLDAECRRLKRAEDWIEGAKRKPLWYNVAMVVKWRWDRFFKKKRGGTGGRAVLKPQSESFHKCTSRKSGAAPHVEASSRPVVHLYAPCLNESFIIPYFLNHYENFVDLFTVFDNGSTDGSLKLLSEHPKVRLVSFDTGGKYDEDSITRMKNHAWKGSRGEADFVVVCDMDEFLYHPCMSDFLCGLRAEGYTIVRPHGFEMTSEQLPLFKGEPITSLVITGVSDTLHYSKTILFDPNRLDEINFSLGCHTSFPVGYVKEYNNDDVKLLHYKHVDRKEVLRKHKFIHKNLSKASIEKNLGQHYLRSDAEVMAAFDKLLADSDKVI